MLSRSLVLLCCFVSMACGTKPTPGADAGVPSDGGAADAGTRLPSGLTHAVRLPAGANASEFGSDLAMALDANGDPMLSYAWARPGGDTAAGAVYFARWDASAAAWSTPVKVDTVGPIFQNSPLRHTAVAFDRSTGTIAVAYGRFNTRTGPPRNELIYSTHLAISIDGGKSFTLEQVSERKDLESGSEEAYLPTLKLAGGKTHLAYFQRYQRCTSGTSFECSAGYYLTRAGTSGAFTRTLLPIAPGTAGNRPSPLWLALDAQGEPGLVYLLGDSAGYNTTVAYWRPGTAAAVKVFDSAGIQNDGPTVALAFDGLKPRVVAALVNSAAPTADLLWSASDDGITWSAALAIPRDGTELQGPYVALSISGGAVIGARAGGLAASAQCGTPKLVRSSNLTTWTPCGLDKALINGAAGNYLNLEHAPDGKLVMSFQYPATTNASLDPGVLVWREP